MAGFEFAKGTWTQLGNHPFGMLIRAGAVCPDGKVRTVKLGIPDTFFSCPGSISYHGKTVTGFISWARDEPKAWVKFTPLGRHKLIFDRVRLGLALDTPEGVVMDLLSDKGLTPL